MNRELKKVREGVLIGYGKKHVRQSLLGRNELGYV